MQTLLDVLIPPRCPGCGLEGTVLCGRCASPLWRRLDEPAGAPLGLAVTVPSGLLQVEWCATYSGPVRAALHALKYAGQRRLTGPLGVALAARWQRVGRGGDLVSWVPVHPSRERERGFDQAEELARTMAAQLGLPVSRCLERTQRTQAQHALGQQARADNTLGAFSLIAGAPDALRDGWIVLVDDILTTGATLAGCAATLQAAGSMVSAITVARDR